MRVPGNRLFSPKAFFGPSPSESFIPAGDSSAVSPGKPAASRTTAGCPPMTFARPGVTSAVVMPAITSRRTWRSKGLNPSITSSCGVLASDSSSGGPSRRSSVRPTLVWASTRPGSTQLPVASITVAPAGTARFAPTAVIFPSAMSTVPLSMAAPLTGTTRPPRMAVTCAGAAASAAARVRATDAAATRVMSWRFMPHLTARAGRR